MGDFGYIYGYVLIFVFLIGIMIGSLGGYYKRKYEEPKDVRKLVDGWNKKSRQL